MGFSIRVECNFTSKAKKCTQLIDSYFCTATSSKSVNIRQDYVFCFCQSGRSASWFPGWSGSSAKPLSAPPPRWIYIPSLGGWILVSSLQPDLAKNGCVALGPLIVIIPLLLMWEETSVSGQWSCLGETPLSLTTYPQYRTLRSITIFAWLNLMFHFSNLRSISSHVLPRGLRIVHALKYLAAEGCS